MKVSALQLAMALSRLKSTVNGYNRSNDDLIVDIEFITADPGNGQMVDAMVLSGEGLLTGDKEDKLTAMKVEIYPASEKQEPRAVKTECFKVKQSY